MPHKILAQGFYPNQLNDSNDYLNTIKFDAIDSNFLGFFPDEFRSKVNPKQKV